MTTLPNRQQIDNAPPLAFDTQRTPQQQVITIEAVCDGYIVRVEYTGTVASIPHAVARLRAAGLEPSAQTNNAQPSTAQAGGRRHGKVKPEYNADGDLTCPVHHKVLKEGKWGLYCPAKDDSTDRGYCNLKFEE